MKTEELSAEELKTAPVWTIYRDFFQSFATWRMKTPLGIMSYATKRDAEAARDLYLKNTGEVNKNFINFAPKEVQNSDFGCMNCAYASCECKGGNKYSPRKTASGKPSCGAYSYYD